MLEMVSIRLVAALLFVILFGAWVFEFEIAGMIVPAWLLVVVAIVLGSTLFGKREAKAVEELGWPEQVFGYVILTGSIGGVLIFGAASGLIEREPIEFNTPARIGVLITVASLMLLLIPRGVFTSKRR